MIAAVEFTAVDRFFIIFATFMSLVAFFHAIGKR